MMSVSVPVSSVSVTTIKRKRMVSSTGQEPHGFMNIQACVRSRILLLEVTRFAMVAINRIYVSVMLFVSMGTRCGKNTKSGP